MNNNFNKTTDNNISPDIKQELLPGHSKVNSSSSAELDLNIKVDNNNDKENLLYGNSITITNPRNVGKVYAFLYIKKYPLIIIGPDCKLNN